LLRDGRKSFVKGPFIEGWGNKPFVKGGRNLFIKGWGKPFVKGGRNKPFIKRGRKLFVEGWGKPFVEGGREPFVEGGRNLFVKGRLREEAVLQLTSWKEEQ